MIMKYFNSPSITQIINSTLFYECSLEYSEEEEETSCRCAVPSSNRVEANTAVTQPATFTRSILHNQLVSLVYSQTGGAAAYPVGIAAYIHHCENKADLKLEISKLSKSQSVLSMLTLWIPA
jgi:hypothetical protein